MRGPMPLDTAVLHSFTFLSSRPEKEGAEHVEGVGVINMGSKSMRKFVSVDTQSHECIGYVDDYQFTCIARPFFVISPQRVVVADGLNGVTRAR